jgi:hypothetical protein
MFSLMPKHKGTDRLRAALRTKIAKSYEEAEKRPFVASKGSQLYCVEKEGVGQSLPHWTAERRQVATDPGAEPRRRRGWPTIP